MDKYLFPEKQNATVGIVFAYQGKLSLMIAPDIGGRIISLSTMVRSFVCYEAKAGQRIISR